MIETFFLLIGIVFIFVIIFNGVQESTSAYRKPCKLHKWPEEGLMRCLECGYKPYADPAPPTGEYD